jgi:hypothetical protein
MRVDSKENRKMVNVFHIVSERVIESPVKAFCGAELDRQLGDYVWADQAQYSLEHVKAKHCPTCLDSDDYALYLLGSAGEGEEPNDVWSGVTTGRLQSSRPNFVNVPRGITKQEVLRMAHDMQDRVSETMLSPTEYAELERKLLK